MFTGKHFRLDRPTFGIESTEDSRVAVTVPANAVIKVLSGPRPEDMRMVDVLWDGRTLTMFAQDIRERCKEIVTRAAHY